jgi:hypothetical protein
LGFMRILIFEDLAKAQKLELKSGDVLIAYSEIGDVGQFTAEDVKEHIESNYHCMSCKSKIQIRFMEDIPPVVNKNETNAISCDYGWTCTNSGCGRSRDWQFRDGLEFNL